MAMIEDPNVRDSLASDVRDSLASDVRDSLASECAFDDVEADINRKEGMKLRFKEEYPLEDVHVQQEPQEQLETYDEPAIDTEMFFNAVQAISDQDQEIYIREVTEDMETMKAIAERDMAAVSKYYDRDDGQVALNEEIKHAIEFWHKLPPELPIARLEQKVEGMMSPLTPGAAALREKLRRQLAIMAKAEDEADMASSGGEPERSEASKSPNADKKSNPDYGGNWGEGYVDEDGVALVEEVFYDDLMEKEEASAYADQFMANFVKPLDEVAADMEETYDEYVDKLENEAAYEAEDLMAAVAYVDELVAAGELPPLPEDLAEEIIPGAVADDEVCGEEIEVDVGEYGEPLPTAEEFDYLARTGQLPAMSLQELVKELGDDNFQHDRSNGDESYIPSDFGSAEVVAHEPVEEYDEQVEERHQLQMSFGKVTYTSVVTADPVEEVLQQLEPLKFEMSSDLLNLDTGSNSSTALNSPQPLELIAQVTAETFSDMSPAPLPTDATPLLVA